MVEHVKRLKRELVYKGAILDIYKDTMELPDGNKAEWDFVSHRMGAAAILPVMKDGRIVMVRQYRNALREKHLKFRPAVGTVRRKIRRIVRHGRWKRKQDTAARM